ncbi:MAG: hypothetical protein IPG67_11200 [Acidobacteria bacterium]|nr:hypothetical protein [Acidobacteriota bacterium]
MDNRSLEEMKLCAENMLNANKNYLRTALSEVTAKTKSGIIKDDGLRKKVVDFLGKAIDHLK